MATYNATNKSEFVAIDKLYCEFCDYNGKKKSDFDKHLLTRKHINAIQATQNATQNSSPKIWSCICKKEFKHSSSYYRHKKNAIITKKR